MKKLIVLGSGGHFNSCAEVIENENKFIISGLVNNKSDKIKNFISHKYKYLGSDKDLKKLKLIYNYAFIAIGQIKSAKRRKNLFDKLKYIGFKIPIILSPSSNVSKFAIINCSRRCSRRDFE